MEVDSPSTQDPLGGPRHYCTICDRPVSVRTITNKYGRQYKYPRKYCSKCEYRKYRKNEDPNEV